MNEVENQPVQPFGYSDGETGYDGEGFTLAQLIELAGDTDPAKILVVAYLVDDDIDGDNPSSCLDYAPAAATLVHVTHIDAIDMEGDEPGVIYLWGRS